MHNDEMFTGLHAGGGFDEAGVETLSSVGQATDYSFEISVVLQEMRSA